MTQAREQQVEDERIVDRRYRVRREIARGGHGVVLEAEHLVTHGRVAIKVLVESPLTHSAAGPRLIREAQILAALRHPNVVSVHDAGTCSIYGPYVAFELIEGRPLDGILLTRHKLPVGQTVALVLQLCEALAEVHRHGVVHRDVKTGNLLVARGNGHDHVTLIDFGIGKVATDSSEVKKITRAGELIGTIEYMAPEQIASTGPVDARADIYSTGMIIYECLTGEVPYTGTPTEVIANILGAAQPPSIRAHRRDVPLALDAVVRQACEIDPNRRFASAAELGRACAAALGSPVPLLHLLDAARIRDDAPAVAQAEAAHGGEIRPDQNLRRQYVRAPYVTPVRVLMGTRTTDGRTEDLSEGGVLIITDVACADAERVKIRLPLPVSGRVVEIEAVARWTKTRRNQGAVGAEFVDAPEEVRAEIRAYVALMTDAAARPRV